MCDSAVRTASSFTKSASAILDPLYAFAASYRTCRCLMSRMLSAAKLTSNKAGRTLVVQDYLGEVEVCHLERCVHLVQARNSDNAQRFLLHLQGGQQLLHQMKMPCTAQQVNKGHQAGSVCSGPVLRCWHQHRSGLVFGFNFRFWALDFVSFHWCFVLLSFAVATKLRLPCTEVSCAPMKLTPICISCPSFVYLHNSKPDNWSME